MRDRRFDLLRIGAGGGGLFAVSALGAPLDFKVVALDRLPGISAGSEPEQRPDMLPDGVVTRGAGTIRADWPDAALRTWRSRRRHQGVGYLGRAGNG